MALDCYRDPAFLQMWAGKPAPQGLTFGLQCPVCGEYRGLGAATDLVKPCAECAELVMDRIRLRGNP